MRCDLVERVIQGICHIADVAHSLAQRRELVLELLTQLLEADFGHWAWGRGDALKTGVVPIALTTIGYNDQQKAQMFQMALDPEMERTFRLPILKRMKNLSQDTSARPQIISDADWTASRMRKHSIQFGGDEWLHSVRYSNFDTWSNVLLIRSVDRPSFDSACVDLLDLAMSTIPWLHATAQETIHAEVISSVTPRQATVMLMLLDGYSRKVIATRLGVTQETVGDHIKAIYRHFDVNSATELAALFLRNK